MTLAFIIDHGREGPASRSKQLRFHMRKWRERLDRTSIAGLVGNKKYVTQEEMAVLCGCALSHYGNLERGRTDFQYSDEFLDTVAAVLRLREVERRVLYLLATGREPKPGRSATPKVTVVMRAMLACQPWPAYVLDPLWNLVAYNEATLRWFPHVATERNVMRAVTCLPQLRTQLLEWDTVWLPRAIAHLKGQLALPAHDEGLDRLAAEVLNRCPQARRWMYNDDRVWMEEDGETRRLMIPGASEPTEVILSSTTPANNSATRYVSVVGVGGHIPPACQVYLPVSG
jgi:transcriptional regulator with XRE-family HTH domain